jgi:hypothetical protein
MKLNERDRRFLIAGAAIAVAVVALNFGPRWIDHWQHVRASLDALQSKMKDMPDEKQRANLLSIVPKLEIPQPEEKQKFLFRDRLHEQLKKAGITNMEPLSFLPPHKKVGAYRTLLVKCKGKCRFDQLLDFLAVLKENEYLMGVEELRIQCDPKKPPEQRQEIDLDMTVSTLVQDMVAKTLMKEPS